LLLTLNGSAPGLTSSNTWQKQGGMICRSLQAAPQPY